MFRLGDLFFTEALTRHQNGDWVNLGDEDWALNKNTLENEDHLSSVYQDRKWIRSWIM
jgi:hypothetical protein